MKKRDTDDPVFKLPGIFITFEGGEGAGKTTLINKLSAELKRQGHQVVTTREPGGSKLGEHIRQWLLDPSFHAKVGDRAELLLFLAARAQHLEELILPALKDGKIVLCDRFNDSTVAYQGVARGLGIEYIQQMCELVCEGLTPDLTFFLDVDPKIGLERTRKLNKEHASEGEVDRIEREKAQFHELVRDAFKVIVSQDPERFTVIDAGKTEDQVYQEAISALKKVIK